MTLFLLRIIKLPFTGSVKLRSLLIKAGPGEYTPSKVYLVRHPISIVVEACPLNYHGNSSQTDIALTSRMSQKRSRRNPSIYLRVEISGSTLSSKRAYPLRRSCLLI